MALCLLCVMWTLCAVLGQGGGVCFRGSSRWLVVLPAVCYALMCLLRAALCGLLVWCSADYASGCPCCCCCRPHGSKATGQVAPHSTLAADQPNTTGASPHQLLARCTHCTTHFTHTTLLPQVPRVSAYRLAAHLTSAFAIYAGLAWTTLSLAQPQPLLATASEAAQAAARKLRGRVLPLSVLVGITAVSGAFVAGLDAGR